MNSIWIKKYLIKVKITVLNSHPMNKAEAVISGLPDHEYQISK